jgi:hypothetical protein
MRSTRVSMVPRSAGAAALAALVGEGLDIYVDPLTSQ